MEMNVTFPKGKQVKASFEGFSVLTDQPRPEGEGAAPTPFNLFLASIGTCVGYFVLSYCEHHGVPSERLRVTMHTDRNTSSHLVEDIIITVHVPQDFPEKYEAGVIRAAGSCLVKRHMEHPPKFSVNIMKTM
jgi:ribosomal protein S12 methylthiotransferase accessory factor